MKAFIFDMDGVIVDSERHWKGIEGFFLRSIFPQWSDTDQARITGMGHADLYSLLTSEYGLTQSPEEFSTFYDGIAGDIYRHKVVLLPGFTSLLAALQDARVPLALASSSPLSWIDIMLDRFALRDAFSVVVSGDRLDGLPGKPDPAIYLLTARQLGVPPEACVVVEDSRNGVLSASSAGMYCIGLRNGFNDEQDLSAAAHIVSGLDQISVPRLLAMTKGKTKGPNSP